MKLGGREILIAVRKLHIFLGKYLRERSRAIPRMPVPSISLKTQRDLQDKMIGVPTSNISPYAKKQRN